MDLESTDSAAKPRNLAILAGTPSLWLISISLYDTHNPAHILASYHIVKHLLIDSQLSDNTAG